MLFSRSWFCLSLILILSLSTAASSAIDFTETTTVFSGAVTRQRAQYTDADSYQNFATSNPGAGGNFGNAQNWNAIYAYQPIVAPVVTDPSAAVIFVHGGAWSSGTPLSFEPFAGHLSSLGVPTFSVGYGLKVDSGLVGNNDPGQFVVEAIQDIRFAIRWVRANSAELGVDPDKIFISGGSAGGHLSLMASLGQDASFNASGDDLNVSHEVSGHVLFNPVLKTEGTGSFGQASLVNHYGAGFDPTLVSPIDQIADQLDATLIMNGTADTTTPLSVAYDFQTTVEQSPNQGAVEVIEYANQTHAFFNASPYLEETRDDMVTWLANEGVLLTTLGVDLDRNGSLGEGDIDIIRDTFLTDLNPNLSIRRAYLLGDLNLDYRVDEKDWALLSTAFAEAGIPGAGGSAPPEIPEPMTLTLLVLGTLGLSNRARDTHRTGLTIWRSA